MTFQTLTRFPNASAIHLKLHVVDFDLLAAAATAAIKTVSCSSHQHESLQFKTVTWKLCPAHAHTSLDPENSKNKRNK